MIIFIFFIFKKNMYVNCVIDRGRMINFFVKLLNNKYFWFVLLIVVRIFGYFFSVDYY